MKFLNASKIAIIATFALFSPAGAEETAPVAGFSIDMDWNEISPKIHKLSVNSLSVGDQGYTTVYSPGLCLDGQNLRMAKLAELETSRNSYSNYFRVTRHPGNNVSLEITNSKGEILSGDKLADQILLLTITDSCLERGKRYWPKESTETATLKVNSINGSFTLSDLFKKFDNKKQTDAAPEKQTDTAHAEPSSPAPNIWIALESKSPIDDSVNATLLLNSEELSGSASRGDLMIRCKDRELDVIVSANGTALFGDTNDRVSVTYRYDSEPAKTGSWSESTNHRSIFYPGKASDMVAQLLRTKQFFIRVQPRRSANIDLTFKVAGLSEHIPVLAKSCKGLQPASPSKAKVTESTKS